MSVAAKMNTMLNQNSAAVHTAFPARVLTCSGTEAKVQPLFNYNGKGASPIDGVPVPQSVRKYKVRTEVADGVTTHWTETVPPQAGDIVYCLCAEQTLGGAWRGEAIDRVGDLHHQLGDAVIVAIF